MTLIKNGSPVRIFYVVLLINLLNYGNFLFKL